MGQRHFKVLLQTRKQTLLRMHDSLMLMCIIKLGQIKEFSFEYITERLRYSRVANFNHF